MILRNALLGLLLLLGSGSSVAAEMEPPPARIPSGVVADDDDEKTPIPVPEPTAKALQYHRTGTALWAFRRLWELAVPLALLLSGTSARLRDLSRRLGRGWFLSIAFYLILFVGLMQLAELPLSYYAGFVRQHEYGLSRQTFVRWAGDTIKANGIEMVGVLCFGWIPFLALSKAPRLWWLILSGLTVPFLAFLTLIAPVWIDPLFNDYGPMKDPVLERKILDLAGRAGIAGGRVFEVNKSVDTTTVNAFVTGLFATKRIVLWDTLLRDFDEGEILAVMGHEMGHFVLNHIPWSLGLSSIVVLAGLVWTDRAGRWLIARYHARFGFESLADVAATPLLLVLLGVSSIVLEPVVLAYSRENEHQADRFALDLTHRNRSAARAFADLQRTNLGVPRPSFIDRIWRASHPSVADRIEFCNTYRPWDTPDWLHPPATPPHAPPRL